MTTHRTTTAQRPSKPFWNVLLLSTLTAATTVAPFAVSAAHAQSTRSSLTSVTLAPESKGALLNLQTGKPMALSLTDGARYSLRSEQKEGSKQKAEKMVKLTAQDGLLLLEGLRPGRVVLVIEAPDEEPQKFVLRISGEPVAGAEEPDTMEASALAEVTAGHTVAEESEVTTETVAAEKSPEPAKPDSTTVTAKNLETDNDKPPGALTLAETAVAQSAIALRALKHELQPKSHMRVVSTRLTVTAQARVVPPLAPEKAKEAEPVSEAPELPALATTSKGNPLPSGIEPIEVPASLPPAPDADKTVDTSQETDKPQETRLAEKSPQSDAANEGELSSLEAVSDGTAQISPNVPMPAQMPSGSTFYPTRSTLPQDIQRAVDDPISRRPRLTVSQGMARVLAFQENILAVFFSDENVMDARAINARTLAVTGKGPGKSTLAIFIARSPEDVVGRAIIYNIEVFPSSVPVTVGFTDPGAAEAAVRAALGDPRIQVRVIQRPDESLVVQLNGTLRDQAEIDAAVSTAALFVPNVISSLYIDASSLSREMAISGTPLTGDGLLQSKIRSIFGNDSIELVSLPGGTALKATVASAAEAEAILSLLPALDRRIQPFIVIRGAPDTDRFYTSDRPVLFGEDHEMTRSLHQVTGLTNVFATRTARNAIAIHGTVRNRAEYDKLRRYSILLPQLQEDVEQAQVAAPATDGATTTTTGTSSTAPTAAPAMSAVTGRAPSPSTRPQTGPERSNLPTGGSEFPRHIQLFVRILDDASAAVRLVTVESSVVEISRNALKDLGAQFGSATVLSETVNQNNGGVTREIDPTFRIGEGLLGDFGGFGAFSNISPVRVRLAALMQNGNAKILSRPNLTTVEGSDASITVGGSRPIPSVTTAAAGGIQTSGVDFRRFGIILTMRPTVTDDDTIILQIRGDVTDLDFNTGIELGGSIIPGERVRSVNTTVTMREGDTLVLGGLITNETREATSRVPILSEIPILGKLFQSKRFENNETELAIFLTPTITRQAGSDYTREVINSVPGLPPLPNNQSDNAFSLGVAAALSQ